MMYVQRALQSDEVTETQKERKTGPRSRARILPKCLISSLLYPASLHQAGITVWMEQDGNEGGPGDPEVKPRFYDKKMKTPPPF